MYTIIGKTGGVQDTLYIMFLYSILYNADGVQEELLGYRYVLQLL